LTSMPANPTKNSLNLIKPRNDGGCITNIQTNKIIISLGKLLFGSGIARVLFTKGVPFKNELQFGSGVGNTRILLNSL